MQIKTLQDTANQCKCKATQINAKQCIAEQRKATKSPQSPFHKYSKLSNWGRTGFTYVYIYVYTCTAEQSAYKRQQCHVTKYAANETKHHNVH